MLTKEQTDEYTKAFGAEPEEDAPEGESGDAASAVTLTETPEDAPTEGATPNAGAETPAEEQAEEQAEPEEPEPPEETQRRKSWEGRLKKREEDLKAREAALASREAPATLADGGKAEPVTLDEGGTNGAVTLADPEAYADGGDVDSLDSIKAEAMELAKDPEKLADAIKSMIADYGREFVVVATAAPMVIVDSRAEEFAGNYPCSRRGSWSAS